MNTYLLTADFWEVADRFGPQTSRWTKIEPEIFSAADDQEACQKVQEMINERGELHDIKLFRQIPLK
jgi:hypothetical protein